MTDRFPRVIAFALLREDAMDDGAVFGAGVESEGGFESLGHDSEDGGRFWWQSDLMRFLGYEDPQSFKKVVGKAMSAVSTLGLDTMDSFKPAHRLVEGHEQNDCQLSRFACYLTAINGDPNKPEIAAAQAYFTAMAEVARQAMLDVDHVERLIARDEVSGAEKSLSGAAKAAGIQESGFGLFRDKGYRGMYNMGLTSLKARKGIDPKAILFDFMGRQELAANLFRVTQTEAKVRNEGIRGQSQLENTAYNVGRVVRETMIRTSGTKPEDLPIEADIHSVRSQLKKTAKGFGKIDRPKKLPKKPPASD